ncbi:MAG TPA: alcohol dehydrogenase catalytic domain-containing protein [Acidimicrobiales bacterium]|nr:alcohol dehydrogenase catalytic domain-containing protein [Acidimicrobiales bacterium]
MTSGGTASALVLEAPRRLRPRTIALPEVGDDDGLLRVEACGLCGTDHEQYTGHLPAGFAFVPGHEAVGVVETVGARAAQRWGVAAGDRVAVEVFQSCRACEECRAGRYRRCARHGLADMYGFIDVDTPPALWGGYATHQYLGPDAMLLPLPAELDPIVATLFNPLGAGIRWTTTVGGAGEGDVVAVLGPGIRGLSACVAAKEAGASFVAITGVAPRDTNRLRWAGRFGADLTIDVASEHPAKALRAATDGRLADVVVDVTAKAPSALGQAVALARPGGTIVLAGTRGAVDTPGFAPDHVVYKELTLVGALGVDVTAYRAAIEVLVSGRWPFAELPRRAVGFAEAEPLLRAMAGEGDVTAPIHAVLVP